MSGLIQSVLRRLVPGRAYRQILRAGLRPILDDESHSQPVSWAMGMVNISKFWVLVSFTVCGLVLFLNYGFLGFNIVTSPAWQVGLFYLALVPFGLAWFAMAVYLLFPRTGGWEWLAIGLGTLIIFGVFALGWWLGGAYSGLRDQRVEDLAAVFCVASSFVVVLLSFGRLAWVRLRRGSDEAGLG